MHKLLLVLLLFSTSLFAQSNKDYLNIEKFLEEQTEDSNDISYIQLHPQFEENPDPNKMVSIEIFFGEYDDSEQSIHRLDLIKEVILDDKRMNAEYPIEVLGYNPESDKPTKNFNKIIKHLGVEDADKKFEQIPETIYFSPSVYEAKTSYVKKEQDRVPSGFSPGRNFWTFMRFSAGAGSTYAALVLAEGIAPGIAASVAVWPGVASGAITYFNGHYGKFLTNGSWARWLLESEKKFAQVLRKGLRLEPKTLEQHLLKTHKKYSKSKYFQSLKNTNPEEFAKIVARDAKITFQRSTNRLSNIAKKFGMLDEYVKWWATEVAFVTTAIKVPQAIGGVGAATSFMGSVGDVLSGSTMGMLAQGPGDLAIQKRKFQKITELETLLGKDGKLKVTDAKDVKKYYKKGLISKEQFNKVDDLVKKGYVMAQEADELIDQLKKLKDPHAGATIGKSSHKALRHVENWARSRATMLSMFSVAGVGMEIAGIPAARPILIGVGAGGAMYYSQVAGWISKERIKKLFTQDIKGYFAKIKSGQIKFGLRPLLQRLCTAKFKPKFVN